MVVFPCPWVRRVRPASPSDVARSYQYSHPDEAQPGQDQIHVIHTSCENVPPPGQNQLESLSRRIRRRFSRESKSSHDYREIGRAGFHFPLRISRSASRPVTQVTMLGDVGSSLMIERGYDSDAHTLSTPNRMGGSTSNRAIRRTDLAELIERSQEQEDSECWETSQPDNAESAESLFGMRFIPTPNSSLRKPRGQLFAWQDKDARQLSLEHLSGQKDPSPPVSPAKSLPNLSATGQESGSFYPEPSQVPHASVDSGNPQVPSGWGKFMAKNRQRYGMISSGSLPNLSTDIMIPKRRQPASSSISNGDLRSVHLGDMSISQRLASETISSDAMSNNHSITELVRRNRHDGFMPLSSDSYRQRHRSGTSAFSGHESQLQVGRERDVSSFYSRQTSGQFSAKLSPRAQSPGVHSSQKNAEKSLETTSDTAQRMAGEGTSSGNGSVQATAPSRSKFREHCDSASSELTLVQSLPKGKIELGSPRKVSIGWMSGGRRVGFGYSLVSDAPEGEQSRVAGDLGQSTPGADDQMDSSGKTPQVQADQTRHRPGENLTVRESKPSLVASQPGYRDVSPMIKPSAQTVEGYPVSPFVQAIFPRQSNRVSEDNEAGALWIDEGISSDLAPPEPSSVLKEDSFETELNPTSPEVCATRWAELSSSIKVRLETQNIEHGNRKSSAGEIVTISPDGTESTDRKTPASDHSTRRASRMNWPPIFMKRKECRRKSRTHQQEPSDTSSGTYVDCEATSLGRTDSTKSVGTDDLVSKYRERMQMPGSFEGSRWANRSTRMLWELCTTDDT